MLRRMGRPGLVGTMARTAVIAGTATAVAGSVQGHQQAKQQAAYDDQMADQQAMQTQADVAALQAQMAAQQAAPAAPAEDDVMAKLEKLGSLHAAGILDDAEFAAAKAKLLA